MGRPAVKCKHIYIQNLNKEDLLKMLSIFLQAASSASLNSSTINDGDLMQDSDPDFQFGDGDIDSSDSEWSSNNKVAINILKWTSKHKPNTSDSETDFDFDLIPLASLISRPRKKAKATIPPASDISTPVSCYNEATEAAQYIVECIIIGISQGNTDQCHDAHELVTNLLESIIANIPLPGTNCKKCKRNEADCVQNKAKSM